MKSIKDIMRGFRKRILMCLIPIRKVILFESNPDFSDNTYWLFKYIAEYKLFDNYTFVWFVKDLAHSKKKLCGREIVCIDGFDKSYRSILRRLYYQYSAKVIIDCNQTIFKIRKNQIRIYLGHGMPIKKGDKFFNDKARGECDLLALLGEGFRKMYEGFGYKDELFVVGYPRNEILYKMHSNEAEKFIIWMPTYRQHKSKDFFYSGYANSFPMGVPVVKSVEDVRKIDQFLSDRSMKLYIRLHPAQDISILNIESTENIIIANDNFLDNKGCTLYEFVACSAALITDYSSIYYDYLLTKRPIGLTFEDAVQYAAKWGLRFENIREELPGHKIDTICDMLAFIEDVHNGIDRWAEAREVFRRDWGIEEFPANRMITEFLQKNI